MTQEYPEYKHTQLPRPPEKFAFTTWKADGVQFIAVPLGNDVHIISENGQNYGSWMKVEDFRKRWGTEASVEPVGYNARLQVVS